jgi:hypothetical protein
LKAVNDFEKQKSSLELEIADLNKKLKLAMVSPAQKVGIGSPSKTLLEL